MMLRTVDEIRERIQLAIIEEVNHKGLLEPENYIPKFIENLTQALTEITLDEIEYRRRF